MISVLHSITKAADTALALALDTVGRAWEIAAAIVRGGR